MIAKVEWHPGELYPRVGFIATNMGRPAERVRRVLQQAQNLRAVDQVRQGRDQVDAAVMPDVRGQHGPPSASCTGLQSWQFPAHAGAARADQGRVAIEPEGEADQDRRQDREPRPIHRLPDGRGGYSEKSLRGHPSNDYGTAAVAGCSLSRTQTQFHVSCFAERKH